MITIETIIVLILCTAGSFGHLFAITILYSMLDPSNLLLISMSCAQLILCMNYLYSTLYKFLADVQCVSTLWSYGWVSVNISVIAHTNGMFHVVALSILRYISLNQLTQIHSTQPWFTIKKSIYSIIIIIFCALIVCVPFLFNSEVRGVQQHATCTKQNPSLANISSHELAFTSFAMSISLGRINFWIFGTICKLVPCSVLVLMSILLLKKLKDIHNISERFMSASREKVHSRTTIIILIIMVVFVFVELPQGILSLISSISGYNLLDNTGELFDILSLLNSCIVFALLCSMNSRIRNTIFNGVFSLLRCRNICKNVR
ncbi:unnamed protein product [Dracunculus medinensis]|uniref:G_PROTEIN_RECEP_F1_2 domain-containing protein n=1 Tax=Dracunculus medinensis TaxID=318479 RepID=A0A158Q494_DRAME|nr:unnamed protein product [Dracunculus medinensis]